MPARDPNKIDVKEAIRAYNVWRCWRIVAAIISRPSGQPYQPQSIRNAVRKFDLQGQS